jgi:hypothetical protein
MFDCVIGYYVNPLSSGVAKFNRILADRWGVPVVQMFSPEVKSFKTPLLSIKLNDMPERDLFRLATIMKSDEAYFGRYGLFLHATTSLPLERALLAGARVVYCGNSQILSEVGDANPHCEVVWAPATLRDKGDLASGDISVFTFGMAHKIKAKNYERLKELLDATGMDYCVNLSTALHESERLIESFEDSQRELDRMFDGRLNFLGYLSDQATIHYLRQSTFFAAFFDHGLRANNTSVIAAMQVGATVITNVDTYSPPEFKHMENFIDVNRCDRLPTDPAVLAEIARRATITGSETLGWEAFDAKLRQAIQE